MLQETESPASFLPRRVRWRGLIVLLVTTYLMWSGFFMIIPVLSVHYVDDLGWTAAVIGLILGLRQFLQQSLTVAGGALADRLGAKRLIVLGLAIRAVAFVGMSHALDVPALLITAILAAIGGSLFDAPSGAAVAALTREDERPRFYSIRGVITGLGLTTGPLIGSALVGIDFAWVGYLSAACYVVAFVITLALLPSVQVGARDRSLWHGTRLALSDRRFLALTGLLMGYWFMWVQLSISLPLEAEALSGVTSSIGNIYLVNSLITIFLQLPIARLLEKYLQPMPALALGVAIMAAGFGGVAITPSFGILLVCIAVFSIGNVIALINQSTVIANLAQPEARGSYFGVSAIALALGGGLGNVIGSALYGESLVRATPAMPWLVIMSVGLAAAIGLWLLNRRLKREQVVAIAGGRSNVEVRL